MPACGFRFFILPLSWRVAATLLVRMSGGSVRRCTDFGPTPLLHGPLPAFLPARVFRELSGLRRAGLCGTDPGSLRFLPAFADACRPGSRSAEPSGTPADAVHRFIYRCESPPHAILRLSATPFSPAGARHRCLSSLLSRPIRFRVGSPPPTARSGIVKNFLNFDCYSFHNSESFFTFVASKDVRFCDVRTLG